MTIARRMNRTSVSVGKVCCSSSFRVAFFFSGSLLLWLFILHVLFMSTAIFYTMRLCLQIPIISIVFWVTFSLYLAFRRFFISLTTLSCCESESVIKIHFFVGFCLVTISSRSRIVVSSRLHLPHSIAVFLEFHLMRLCL